MNWAASSWVTLSN